MAETPSELQAEIEKLERKHAENPEGRFFVPLANAYRKLGQLPAAESLLREGLRRYPEYLSAHIVLGRCLSDRSALEEAAQEFRYVLSLDPQNLIALRSLGELSLSRGRTDEAGRWYRELLTADPMNEEARRALEGLQASSAPPREGEPPHARSPRPEHAAPAAPPEPVATPLGSGDAEEAPVSAEPPSAEGEDFGFYGGYIDLDDAAPAVAEPLAEEDEEEAAPDLVTETIADLYARQGLYDRSAEVYRELIRRRGGDAGLERRLEEVERLAAGAEPVAAEPPPEPEPGPEPEALLEPSPAAAFDADPFAASFAAGFEEPEPEEPADEIPLLVRDEQPARREEPVAAGEPTIAQFLAGLAAWSPGSAAGALPEAPAPAPAEAGTGSAGDELFPWELPESDAPAPAPAESGPGGELEREPLLSYGDYLAGTGEPEEEGSRAEAPPESAPRPAGGTGPAAAEDDDDLESFQAWLRSLKR